MPMKQLLLGIALVLCFACLSPGLALAQEEGPTKVTEADYQTFQKLRYSHELARTRKMFSRGDDAKEAAAEAELAKALGDAGWTAERYQSIEETIDAVTSDLQMLDSEEEREMAKESLEAMDKTTVETVKAHLKDPNGDDALSKRAMEQIREEKELAKRGEPVDAAKLEGTWVADIEATAEVNTQDYGPELKQQMAETLRKTLPKSSYVFGPGDRIEAITEQAGANRHEKGTYRVEGTNIIMKADGRSREYELKAGMKDGTLRIGMMGIYTVFKRAQ